MYSISMLCINFKFCGFERRSRMKKLFTARHRKIERFKDKGRKHFFSAGESIKLILREL